MHTIVRRSKLIVINSRNPVINMSVDTSDESIYKVILSQLYTSITASNMVAGSRVAPSESSGLSDCLTDSVSLREEEGRNIHSNP